MASQGDNAAPENSNSFQRPVKTVNTYYLLTWSNIRTLHRFCYSIGTYFASLRKNSEFQQTHWQKTPLVFEQKISETAFSMLDLKEAVDTDFLEAGRGQHNLYFLFGTIGLCFFNVQCFFCRNVSRWQKWLEYGGRISSSWKIFPRCQAALWRRINSANPEERYRCLQQCRRLHPKAGIYLLLYLWGVAIATRS